MNIRCKDDYLNLIDKMKKSANEVNGTYEVLGESCVMMETTQRIKEIFDISNEFETEFLDAITKMEEKNIGPYITQKYFMLIPALKKAIKHIKEDCLETRRCVIDFPPEHCFRSIQFLIRGNTIHVVCYMRSCNAIKNLPHDIWICSKMADIFSEYVTKLTGEHPYEFHSITMMFGSLHVFKDDLKDVF